MMTSKQLFGIAFALVALPVCAQAVQGQIEVGVSRGYDLGNKDALGKYENVPTGPGLYSMDLRWDLPSNYWMEMGATDLGTNTQSAWLRGGKRGDFKWRMGWDELPYVVGQNVDTHYVETNPGVFRLPDALRSSMQSTYWTSTTAVTVAANTPGNVALGTALAGLFPNKVDLGTQRRTATGGLEITAIDHVTLNLDYRYDRREGNQITPIYDGTTIAQFAAPIDYKTHNFNMNAQYANGRWFAEVGMDLSRFTDGVERLYVDNPMRLTNVSATNPTTGAYYQQQAAVMGMPTAPDNSAFGWNVAGGVNLPLHHRVVASYTSSSMEMETGLMAGSTIPYYADQTGGYNTINARMDTSLTTLKVMGDPMGWLGYSVSYRRYELKDKTFEYYFPLRGRGDSTAPTADPHGHEDESWKKDSVKAEVHFKPMRGMRLGAFVSQDNADYKNRFAEEVKDTIAGVTFDGTFKSFSVRAAYSELSRTPSKFEEGETPDVAGVGSFNDQARRTAKIYNAVLTYMPTDDLAVSFTAAGVKNTFPDAPLHGLQDSRTDTYGMDFTYSLTDRFSLNGAYVYEYIDSRMISQYLGTTASTALAADKWANKSRDQVDTFKAGFRWQVIPGKLDLTSDFDYSQGRGDSVYTVGSLAVGATHSWQSAGYNSDPNATTKPYGFNMANAGPFLNQEVVNRIFIWKTQATYRFTKQLSGSLLLWLQRYDKKDWAQDAMSTYTYLVDPGANKSIFMGRINPAYDAKVIRASVSYRF